MSRPKKRRGAAIFVASKRLGVYGKCPTCKGEGCVWANAEIKRLHEAWEDEPPPSGEGFQLWTTTSEGAPISPVFASLDALAEWCEPNATTFGSFKTTKAEWIRMLEADCVVHVEGNKVFL